MTRGQLSDKAIFNVARQLESKQAIGDNRLPPTRNVKMLLKTNRWRRVLRRRRIACEERCSGTSCWRPLPRSRPGGTVGGWNGEELPSVENPSSEASRTGCKLDLEGQFAERTIAVAKDTINRATPKNGTPNRPSIALAGWGV